MLSYLTRSLNLRAVAAFIDTRNGASHRLAEALGFSRVRRLGNADFFNGASSDEYEYRYES